MANHYMYCEFCGARATNYFTDTKETRVSEGGYIQLEIDGETHARCALHDRPAVTIKLNGDMELDYPGEPNGENFTEILTARRIKEDING